MQAKLTAALLFLSSFFFHASQAQSAAQLWDSSNVAFNEGRLSQAIKLAEQAVATAKKDSGAHSIFYAAIADNAAALYIALRMVDEAMLLNAEALAIYKKEKGPESYEYISSTHNTANIAIIKGDFDEAERLLTAVVASVAKHRGEQDSAYAEALSGLGAVYYSRQDFGKAIFYGYKTLQVYETYYPHHTAQMVYILNNLGEAYRSIGNFERSNEYLSKALSFYTTGKLPDADPMQIPLLNNLAMLHHGVNQNDSAVYYLKKCLEKLDRYSNKQNHSYLNVLNNYSYVLYRLGQYNEALKNYNEVLALWKIKGGEQTSFYATTLSNMALVHIETGNVAIADSLFNAALSLLEKNGSHQSLLAARVLFNKAGLLQRQQYFQEALSYYKRSDSIVAAYVHNLYGVSATEKLNIIDEISFYFQGIPTLLHQQKGPADKDAVNEVYRIQLLFKNLALRGEQQLLRNIGASTDATLRQMHQQWKANKMMLAKIFRQQGTPKNTIDSLEKDTEALERAMSDRSASFAQEQLFLKTAAADVAAKLQPGEAAIEFIRYALRKSTNEDSIFYAAILLKPGQKEPEYIRLCNEKDLAALLRPAGGAAGKSMLLTELYQAQSPTSKGARLYQKIWAPLLPALQKVHTVYLSPAGLLHQVSFKAIPAQGAKMLGDQYIINYMLSTGDLAAPQNKTIRPAAINLWADVDFGQEPTILKNPIATASSKRTGATKGANGYTTDAWPRLALGQKQIIALKMLAGKAAVPLTVQEGKQASEEAFKNMTLTVPSILHLSTHGFYLQSSTATGSGVMNMQTAPAAAQNSLLQSGLLLSGANATWLGQPAAGAEDGICTAYEIAQLNLTNATLVVLDACETALGNVHASEGVFGLQRSFRLAGAGKLIMSLWAVPEKHTLELMTLFYTHWTGGKTIGNAFNDAQAAMRQKYPPYYWAGFVLVE